MTKEGTPHEASIGKDRHTIGLGVPFKPYERIRSYYHASKGRDALDVPEAHKHYLYLRRRVSLYGINGVVDVISEDPESFITQWAVKARNYRLFLDHPFGWVKHELAYKGNGVFENIKAPALLRFSFLVTTPSDYTKLLCTYADVDLGKDRFLLTFNLNQLAIKRDFALLEQGRSVLVTEKNLFNHKKLEETAKEDREEGVSKTQEQDKASKEDPGRIAFVDLPVDFRAWRRIQITFHKLFDGGEREYPTEPIQPNRQPIPILV